MKDENTNKISKKREIKVKIVSGLEEKVEKSKVLVFTNYQGMTHKQLEELKRAVKKTDGDFIVTKNTLIKKALAPLKVEVKGFDLPTATLFAYSDIVSPLKELSKMIKILKLPLIKYGILDGKQISEADVLKLASLPTREVLLAQVVGGLKSPIFGLHRALNWNFTKLVLTLKAIETKKV